MNPKAVIFGCSGLELTADERAFFRDTDPLGFIVFARNIDSPDQARKLIDDLRKGEVAVLACSGNPRIAPWGELLSTASKARGAARRRGSGYPWRIGWACDQRNLLPHPGATGGHGVCAPRP